MKATRATAAFTLIELLAVLALMVSLAGVTGLALTPRGGVVAAESAQHQILQSLAAARLQAALHGRNAALLVHADPGEPERYLRAVLTAVRDPSTGVWVPLGRWTPLPEGMAVLPPHALIEPWVSSVEEWAGLRSDALSATPVTIAGTSAWMLELTPRGTVVGGGGRIGLVPGRNPGPSAGALWRFEQPAALRGIAMSAYGVADPIDARAEW